MDRGVGERTKGRGAPPAARVRRATRIGVLGALAAASGYLFASIPNIEAISLIVFLSGARIGWTGGLLVALFGRGIFSLVNPWGPAPPLILIGSVCATALFGVAGGCLGAWLCRPRPAWASAAWLALIGGALTAAHDLITNLATAATIGLGRNPIPVLLSGIPFAVPHILSNTLLFAVVGLPLLARFARAAREERT